MQATSQMAFFCSFKVYISSSSSLAFKKLDDIENRHYDIILLPTFQECEY